MDELENDNYTRPEPDNLTATQYTSNTKFEDALAHALSNYQIVVLVWCIVCILPNILLLYIFIKNHLYHINFYFVLMNWCLSDLIYIVTMFYFLAVPEKHVDKTVMDILYYINTVIPTLGLLFVTPFLFESFLKSGMFCKYLILSNWFVLIVYTTVVIILCNFNYYFVEQLLYVVGFWKVLCVAVLIVKILIFFIKQQDDESAGLRIIMAGLYILMNFYVWFFELLTVLELVTVDFFEFVLFASYADAYVNLVLLLNFNTSMKCYFYQLCNTYDKGIIVDDPEEM